MLSRQWDGASRNQRIALLSTFIMKHKHSTATEIERDLGHGALLFFTRVTAWLRLTYQLGYELSVQLTAISLFLQGQKFLTNFIEVGGVQLLTDMLCHVGAFPSDKYNTLLLLIHLANSGRVYREMLCDGCGVDLVVRATVRETDVKTLELLASLFVALGQGNPRKATLLHSGLLYVMVNGCDAAALCASTTLRSLQLTKEHNHRSMDHAGEVQEGSGNLAMVGAESGSKESTTQLLDAFFHLIRSDSVPLRFEGAELLSLIARNEALVLPVLTRCFDLFDDDPSRVNSGGSGATIAEQRQRIASGRTINQIILRPSLPEHFAKICSIVDRRQGHVTLVKFLHVAEPRDAMDTCKAMAKLLIGPARRPSVKGGALPPSAMVRYLEQLVGRCAVESLVEHSSSGPLQDVPENVFVTFLKQLNEAELDSGHSQKSLEL